MRACLNITHINHISARRRSTGDACGVRRRGLLRAQEVQVLLPGGIQAAGIAGGQVPSRRRLEEQRRAAEMRRHSGGDVAFDSSDADEDDNEPMDNKCTSFDNDDTE